MLKTMLAFGAAGLLVSGNVSAAEKASAGAELLEKRCSVCHSADRPKGAKKTKVQWEETVTRMMDKGAKLSGDEKKTLVEYLAATYKP